MEQRNNELRKCDPIFQRPSFKTIELLQSNCCAIINSLKKGRLQLLTFGWLVDVRQMV